MTALTKERADWLSERRRYVGASEVAAILGLSPYDSPYSLWAKKTGQAPDDEEPEWIRWGVLIEPLICDEYARETGRRVVDHGRHAFRVSATCPHLGATLDREVIDAARGSYGVLEAKNVSAYKLSDWEDGAPLLYQIQVQAQLEVTGYRWGSAAALVGGNTFKWCDIERDDAFIEMMRRKVAEFWRYVETDTPPPIDGSESTAEALRRLYPKDSGKTIALDGNAMTWRDEMVSADLEIEAATERKNLAKNKIIAAIGDATFAILPDGERFSFKQTTRKETTVKASTYRTLRRHAK